ncbi:MAG: hypothetical protein JWO69_2024 [Thermoleophilia bacterium]|nr:hypothetical protein [Thermoleophilia bacterium]
MAEQGSHEPQQWCGKHTIYAVCSQCVGPGATLRLRPGIYTVTVREDSTYDVHQKDERSAP